MTQTVLYLLRRPAPDPLLDAQPGAVDSTVVLLEDAVRLHEVPARTVFALEEDAAARRVTPTFPTISYGQLVDLLFASDRVVLL